MVKRAMDRNKHLKIIYKGTLGAEPIEPVDIRPILMDRIKYLPMKPKKKKLQKNIGYLFYML